MKIKTVILLAFTVLVVTLIVSGQGNRNNLTLYRQRGLNVNQTNTDIGSFTNLPAKYIVRRLTVDNCSATPTASTVDLRTATAGGGTAIVSGAALAGLTATTTFLDTTLAVTTATQTAATLTVRSVVAAGGAATCDFTLELTPLP